MDIVKIIAALKGARWYLVVAAFFGFALYTLKDPVERFLDRGTEKWFENMPERIDRDIIVNDLLSDLMFMSGADRAYIFRFHNGQNYFDGSHKLRMSCEYEVVSVGIEPKAQNLQDIPTSLYSKFISQVIDGKMFYEDIEDIEDLTTKVALKRQGIKSVAVAPYFDNNGNLIAMIGVDYVGRKADRQLILERQRGSLSEDEWVSQNQRIRFINAINSIGDSMLNQNI